jgi:hypothetical protein
MMMHPNDLADLHWQRVSELERLASKRAHYGRRKLRIPLVGWTRSRRRQARPATAKAT